MHKVTHKGHERIVEDGDAFATLETLMAEFGPYVPGETTVEKMPDGWTVAETATPQSDLPATPERRFSDWGEGKQIIDAVAADRIQKLQDAVNAKGGNIDASQQRYATGTRMAEDGYKTQTKRQHEHERLALASLSLAAFSDRIVGEKRHERRITAGELVNGLSINGKLAWNGYALREQAIKGLLQRLGSPAYGYVFGLRDRIAEKPGEDADGDILAAYKAGVALDKAALLDVLQREARRFPDREIMLRLRDGLQDIFAITSHDYGIADAPSVMPDVLRALPSDARASVKYNQETTAWEVQAAIWTPTPVQEQAVGEPFRSYLSISSRDNGTGRLSGGGGLELLACLNAMIYVANQSNVSRVHRGNILTDLAALVSQSAKAFHALATAWGEARADVIELPTVKEALIPIEVAIPGFYRNMLTVRKGELLGVLKGRTETHVKSLAAIYPEQRRDKENITRADLANAFTNYIQTQPDAIRANAEARIGNWVVKGEPVSYVAD